jgi:hypothetical protein
MVRRRDIFVKNNVYGTIMEPGNSTEGREWSRSGQRHPLVTVRFWGRKGVLTASELVEIGRTASRKKRPVSGPARPKSAIPLLAEPGRPGRRGVCPLLVKAAYDRRPFQPSTHH